MNSPAEENARLHARDIEGEQQAIVKFPYAVKLLEQAAQSLHANTVASACDEALAQEIDTFTKEAKDER